MRIVILSADDAVLVPVSALFRLPGNGSGDNAEAPGAMGVFVVRQGRVERRSVEVVARNGTDAWVRRGVEPGESVVVYAPAGVGDGSRVAVRAR